MFFIKTKSTCAWTSADAVIPVWQIDTPRHLLPQFPRSTPFFCSHFSFSNDFAQEGIPNCQTQDWIKSFLAVYPRIKSNIPRLWDIWSKAPQTISITTLSTVDFNHLFPLQTPQPDCKTLEARDHYTLCILLSLPCSSHSILCLM